MAPRLQSVGAVISLLLLTLASTPTAWTCDRPASQDERLQCIGIELKGADATINRTYTDLMRSLQTEDRDALRKEQLDWIASRDRTCRLRSTARDRDAWFAAVLRDPQKTVCVVRLTNERVERLNQYLRGEPLARATGASAPVYELASTARPAKGKFYFEIVIDRAAVLKHGEAAFFVGVQPVENAAAVDASGSGAGSLISVRRVDAADYTSPMINGFAVDLDNGRLYIRHDGEWNGGAPGSAGGIELMGSRAHFGEITSSVSLNALLKSGAISVNWGSRPFAHDAPDGYRPLEIK